ncbi:MAG: type III-B CRISPR module-associated Cmr3 family protein [Azovibrio sp.]|uniref:type III-B CRISPR module-associated Cmr3 family protein n=1 Tax=Azovibrio sp. TaxID=1872673 RepID=UPI003C776902
MNALLLEPLDVLYLRGNKLFGDAGSHGEALMPPWPSLAAGALRSRLMAAGSLLESLADFRLTLFGLARQSAAHTALEPLWPLPADVVVNNDHLSGATYLRPQLLPTGLCSSYPLARLPTLCADTPAKPVGGLWLSGTGIGAWLAGQPIQEQHLLPSSALWKLDSRLGIALDAEKRSAADGMIYTSEAVALKPGVGFVAAYEGHDKTLQDGDLVRLGGDGRAARLYNQQLALPAPDWARIEREGCYRLILTTPGIFAAGWQPEGVPGQLLAACVSRADTISGWDLATGKPKPAQRTAPTGSVYWYQLSGKLAELGKLQQLADNGLPIDDPMRRAEGFNHCRIAPWAEET